MAPRQGASVRSLLRERRLILRKLSAIHGPMVASVVQDPLTSVGILRDADAFRERRAEGGTDERSFWATPLLELALGRGELALRRGPCPGDLTEDDLRSGDPDLPGARLPSP